MTGVETALIRIGTSVASAVFKAWLKNKAGGKLDTASVVGLIDKNVGDAWERRKVRRQFDQMAEEIARSLQPYIDVEYGGLRDNEKNAAILAVADTLENATPDIQRALRVDLDPRLLEKDVRASGDARRRTASLAASALLLFDGLLRESCTYAVEVASSLPDFTAAATREILARETLLEDLVRQALIAIPQAGHRTMTDADADFETQYRREVARRLDSLELFGLNVSEVSRRYKLSIAYLTLSAMSRDYQWET